MTLDHTQNFKSRISPVAFKIILVILVVIALFVIADHGARLNHLQSMKRTFEHFSGKFNAYVADHPGEPLPTVEDLKKNPDFYMDNLVFTDASALRNSKPNLYILYFAEGKPADWLTPDKIVAINWMADLSEKERTSALFGDGRIQSLDRTQWETLIAELIFGHNPPRPFTLPSSASTSGTRPASSLPSVETPDGTAARR